MPASGRQTAPRPRRPITVLLALLAPILFVAGIWLGGHPGDLPAFARGAFVPNHATEVVDEAINRIASDYYRPIPKGKLADASIGGAVASLDDRFSHYLDPSEFRQFSAPPSFTGIGVMVAPDSRNAQTLSRGLLIVRVFDASPAKRAGLQAGDLIAAVNGHRLAGMSPTAAASLIKGPPATDVVLTIQGSTGAHGGHPATRTVKITRATIDEPVVASQTVVVRGVKLGVIALATFSAGAHAEVREAVERELHAGARGLVFDLRANGGGLVEEAQLIASIFIPSGTIVTTRGARSRRSRSAPSGVRSRPRSRWSCWSTATPPRPRRS